MGNRFDEWEGERWQARLRLYAPVVLIYIGALICTGAAFMGDTVHYVNSVMARIEGGYLHFWEFGHLLWRPLGWLAYKIFSPVTSLFVGADTRYNVTFILIALNWATGLLAALALNCTLRRVCKREWVLITATAAFIFSNAFLDYIHAGCAYVPGLAFLLVGFAILTGGSGDIANPRQQRQPSVARGVWGGAALAVAIGFWFPYVLSVPAALVAPLLLFGFTRARLKVSVAGALSFALVAALMYALVVFVGLGIRDLAGLKAWFTDASHGITNMKGFSRSAFGFARSLIHMGDDGRIFKRFLIGDPFNPVSLWDLFRLGLWKFVFFYLFMAGLLLSLLRTPDGRRMFLLFVLNAVPMFVFAIFIFESGAIERYLPLFPLIFLALAFALCSERTPRAVKYLLLAYVAAATLANLSVMAKPVLNRQKARAETRVKDLQPHLKPGSRVVTSHIQDELVQYNQNFLFDPVNTANLTFSVVEPNSVLILTWRSRIAEQILPVWERGDDVWLSKRLLAPRPRAEWNWVEGDDPRVSWTHLYDYFRQLELGQQVGDDDGFALLLPSEQNKNILRGHMEREKQVFR